MRPPRPASAPPGMADDIGGVVAKNMAAELCECRACLRRLTPASGRRLFGRPSLAAALNDVALLQVAKGDGFPSYLCLRCVRSLRQSFRFKKLCRESDAKLRENPVAPRVDVRLEEIERENRDDFDYEPEEVERERGDRLDDRVRRERRDCAPAERDRNQLRCEICDQTFSYKQTLTRHMKIHSSGGQSKLCAFCGKSFVRTDDLKRHVRIHTGERPYSCDRCPKRYKQSSELKDHAKSHSDAKCYVCTECGKSLATRNGLYVHMKVHRGEKTRECKICEKRFVTNGELNSHVSHVHSREKPFKCAYDDCERAFATKLSLKTHLRAHTGEKPFKCEICEKSLATSSSLSEHKRIHTGEKPKTCSACGKGLRNSQALKKHMMTHTGERPYRCEICFDAFACGSTLNAHVKIKHAEKQHACPVCDKKFAFDAKLRKHMKVHDKLDKKGDATGESYVIDFDQCQLVYRQDALEKNEEFNGHLANMMPAVLPQMLSTQFP